MEETRSFGYICPKCGRAVMARHSAFSLAAAAAHIECPCGQSDMLIETDGSRFRLWVPCGLCGETHQAECSADAVLRGRGIGLACPKTRQICCYVGQEDQVSAQMEQLAVRAAKEKAEDPEAFTDNIIMYEVLSELKDIAARGGIRCRCGSTRYGIQVHRDSVDLCCQDCGGKLRLRVEALLMQPVQKIGLFGKRLRIKRLPCRAGEGIAGKAAQIERRRLLHRDGQA